MARANFQFHGFQFYKTVSGNEFPQTVRGFVASAYGTALYPGQPVTRQSDGSYARTAAGSGTAISGVISRILQFRNSSGVLVTNARVIPASITYTDNEQATMIEIIPARGHLFRVCGDTATPTSLANARTFEGENADHIYDPSGGAASAALGLSGTFLDISTHNTTNTLQWRIRQYFGDDGGRMHNEPTLAWQQWVVEANVITDIPGASSATGV